MQRAAAAAAYAVAAVRKPHLAHLDGASRARVEREALRIRLHQHVQRELAKHTATVMAAALNVGSADLGADDSVPGVESNLVRDNEDPDWNNR